MDKERQITYYSVQNKDNNDILVYQCGMEKCNNSYFYGPAVRDHYLIHVILKGKGKYYVNNKVYDLHSGQGFFIAPDVITYYEADRNDPWTYTWVGFKGLKAERFLKMADINIENPVFNINNMKNVKEYFKEMCNVEVYKLSREVRLQGLLLLFLSELIEQNENKTEVKQNYRDTYIKKTLQFIEMNYNRKISVEDMADNIGLNKNYFSTMFKSYMKMSPQNCLLNFRINKACELLKNTDFQVSDIARSVGYNDPLGFSKIFKKEKGVSPKEYRINHNKNK